MSSAFKNNTLLNNQKENCMKYRQLHLKSLAAALICGSVLVLAGCGGGSGDATAVAAAPAPTTFTVTGTAATGAAFANATVTVIGGDGTPYGGGATDITGSDGQYSITLPLTAVPPFVVQAVRDDKTLVSVLAEAKDTTTNITPVTSLIASRLSTSGDPAKLAQEINDNYKAKKPAFFDATALQAKVKEVVALIKPLMDAVPGSTTDPLNGKLVVDGTGDDKVLDSLSINITPSSATSANIEIAVKQKLADGANPAVIAFTNATTATELAAKPALTVTESDLVTSGSATLIADLLERMTACYALPQSDRVASGGTAATDIVAPACKDIFFGKDPAGFKHNGAVVSSTGAFALIFDAAAVGAKFDRGSYEFTRSNGDLVIAFRSTTGTTGSTANNVLVVRADADKKLRAIGNQYAYDGGVNAMHELRTFIAQRSSDYYGTGFRLSVSNTLDAAGKPLFAKVVVTSPKGGVFTLAPSSGLANLTLVKNNAPLRTSFVRISNAYVDPANSGNPADADVTQFSSPTPATDEQIAGYGAQGSWTFDYYLASAPTTIAATQYYKTRARPLNIAELRAKSFATLADADISTIMASLVANSSGFFLPNTYLPSPATGPLTLNWVVPAAALAPTVVTVFGGTKSLSYNDKVSVASSSRTTSIACSPASAADTHCTTGGDFAAGGFSVVQLWANDPAGRELASLTAFYNLATPTAVVAIK